ncbi:MAG: hypothetical protein IKX25_05585 [Bacteroidales bacterium]|nr:hypothetical protein [Bacteroidales bacterium]
MDVIIVQSEGAIQFYPSPKGSSSRQEIINLLLMAARTLELVLLEAFVVPFGHVREKGANIANHTTVGIVRSYLLYCAVLVHDHAVIAHVVLYVIVPTVYHAICVECGEASIEQVHRRLAVLEDEIADIVDGICQRA